MTATPVATPPRSRTGAATWSASSPSIDCAPAFSARPASDRSTAKNAGPGTPARASVATAAVTSRESSTTQIARIPGCPASEPSAATKPKILRRPVVLSARLPTSTNPPLRARTPMYCRGRSNPSRGTGRRATEKRRPDRRVCKTGPSISSSAVPTPVWLSPLMARADGVPVSSSTQMSSMTLSDVISARWMASPSASLPTTSAR